MRDSLRTEKEKERYDRNYNSIETTFTQKELEEHNREIRNKAIDEFVEWCYMNGIDFSYMAKATDTELFCKRVIDKFNAEQK